MSQWMLHTDNPEHLKKTGPEVVPYKKYGISEKCKRKESSYL